MTDNEMLQKVVEAAGECWHSHHFAVDVHIVDDYVLGNYIAGHVACVCGKMLPDHIYMNLEGEEILHHQRDRYLRNPSPSDLNELFRLAEKLEHYHIKFDRDEETTPAGRECIINSPYLVPWSGYGDDYAETLLHALYEAIKES